MKLLYLKSGIPIQKNQFKLEVLLSDVTKENMHSRLDFGVAVGKELI